MPLSIHDMCSDTILTQGTWRNLPHWALWAAESLSSYIYGAIWFCYPCLMPSERPEVMCWSSRSRQASKRSAMTMTEESAPKYSYDTPHMLHYIRIMQARISPCKFTFERSVDMGCYIYFSWIVVGAYAGMKCSYIKMLRKQKGDVTCHWTLRLRALGDSSAMSFCAQKPRLLETIYIRNLMTAPTKRFYTSYRACLTAKPKTPPGRSYQRTPF